MDTNQTSKQTAVPLFLFICSMVVQSVHYCQVLIHANQYVGEEGGEGGGEKGGEKGGAGGWSRRVEQEAMVAAKGSAQQRMGVSKRGEAA